jgi:uncharacterized protein (TIGR03118 family)
MSKLTISLFLTLTPVLMQAATGYLVHNLVADDPSTAVADFYDPRLVNPWGNVASATSPFWVCDGGTGLSTIYTVHPTNATPLGTPNAATQPTVPGAGGIPKGVCTGIVANIAPATTPPTFPVTAPGRAPVAASFIFVTEDGVLSAWANGADPSQALVAMDNSATAVYKGLTLVTTPSPQLYAANFKAGTIDVFDANFKPVTLASGAFTDPKIPAGFAPFNIWNIGGKLYVAYAKQDSDKKFDVRGVGNGYVDVYDSTGKLLQSLVAGGTGSRLNSPWGLAIAPPTFGKYANALLVGNFGDGLINAYDLNTGAFLGTLQDATGKDIVLPGLWAIIFGNGSSGGDKDTLYFTAGPGGQKRGLLGSISANPNVASSDIINAAQPTGVVAANTYVTIKGTDLAATKRTWQAADFVANKLPTALDGVTVTMNGEAAYIYYISPVQINLLTPSDLPSTGQITVQISNNGLTAATLNIAAQAVAPSLFLINSDKYVNARHSNNVSVIGPTTLIANVTTPAAPGETIVLYATGCGATTPPVANGQIVTLAQPLAATPMVLVNNAAATVRFAGLIAPGVYQLNVILPTSLPDGDVPVVLQVGGFSSPAGALITIRN